MHSSSWIHHVWKMSWMKICILWLDQNIFTHFLWINDAQNQQGTSKLLKWKHDSGFSSFRNTVSVQNQLADDTAASKLIFDVPIFLTEHVLTIATVVFHVFFLSQANIYFSSSNFSAIFVTYHNWRGILSLIIARKSTQFDRNMSMFNLVVHYGGFLIYSKFPRRLQCIY